MRNLSVITAVEESDGRDSFVVRRSIEIVSNPRHNLGYTILNQHITLEGEPLTCNGVIGTVWQPFCSVYETSPYK